MSAMDVSTDTAIIIPEIGGPITVTAFAHHVENPFSCQKNFLVTLNAIPDEMEI